MTSFSPTRPTTIGTARAWSGEPVSAASAPDSGPALALWCSRPTRTSVVVHVEGELDTESAPRLHELLAPSLFSAAETVILDLSGLRFLGVTGLLLLAHAYRRAASRSMTCCLVDGPVCVDRALRAAGWAGTVPAYPSVAAALAETSGHHEFRATG